jgi:hypothetical protein
MGRLKDKPEGTGNSSVIGQESHGQLVTQSRIPTEVITLTRHPVCRICGHRELK